MAATIAMQTIWRQGTTQQVSVTASSTAIGTKFGSETHAIRVCATTACYYLVGDGAQTAAATTSSYLPAHWVETVKVTPGQLFATIYAATSGLDTATTGLMTVVELTS